MDGEVSIVQDTGGGEAQAVALPNPISVSTERHDADPGAGDKPEARALKATPEKKLSIRDSLEAAAKRTEAKDADKGKAVETKSTDRDDTGKFKAKDGDKATAPAKVDATKAEPGKAVAHAEAPTRFSADAKAAWATAPEPVRAEVHRALRELDQGIARYKPDAENFAPFKEFHALAKSMGSDPAAAIRQYVGIDKMLGENFPEAITRIFNNRKVDMRTFAADVLGLNADQRAVLKVGGTQQQSQPMSPEVVELRRTVAGLQQQIGALTGNVQQQQQTAQQTQAAAVQNEIEAFKATNPVLFDELSTSIAWHIENSGLSLADAHAKALSDFQAMAQRGGLIPQPANTTEKLDLAAQTLKGQKSITGAPGAGSDPARRKPSSSIREALEAAAQQIG